MPRYRKSYRSTRSIGYERAREHIRQAESLSQELGGTDKDVKAYFFALSSNELNSILLEYEELHGEAAREYAEKTMAKWKSGRVHMSGMVAERLFSLLPKRMPIDQKYKLTENLWHHVAPKSNRDLYVNPSVPILEIENAVRACLQQDVLEYKIPTQMESRFNWLSQGDVSVKQQLLNHIRAKERELATESIRINLPLLIDHLSSGKAEYTQSLAHNLKIGRNEISVTLTDKVEGITEIRPITKGGSNLDNDSSWLWWIFGIVVLLIVFGS